MENNQIIVLIITIFTFLVLSLVLVIIFLFLRILKDQNTLLSKNMSKPEVAEQVSAEIIEECVNHKNIDAIGICAICNESICETCLKDHDNLTFCHSHFHVYLSNEWHSLDEVKTTPETPETALFIYDFKKNIWEDKQTPAILSTQYKINIEGDYIESYVRLLVLKEQSQNLEKCLQDFKQEKAQ